jgi:hypothetical protein
MRNEEIKQVKGEIDDYLTERERRKLLSNLHCVLIWAGFQDPDRLKIDRDILKEEIERDHLKESDLPPEMDLESGVIRLRNLVWRLIHMEELSDKDKIEIKELIRILESKEKQDAAKLEKEKLTHPQAEVLYKEAAQIIRTIMDLKDLLKKKEQSDIVNEEIRKKVEQTKRWNAFMEQAKGKQ